jgi:1-deoxy-D-xylulose-5-phosphate reductoisomerase
VINHRSNPSPPSVKRVILLGSTGSIGTQTLEVMAHLNTLHEQGVYPTRFELVAVAAGSDAEGVVQQARRWGVRDIALRDAGASVPEGFDLREGDGAATRLVEEVESDLVVGAIVGIAGLPSTLRAAQLGIDVALANKESLVAAGSLVTRAAFESGSRLLPLDSEHAGIWQCLAGLTLDRSCPPMHDHDAISRVILTASGGAFRDRARDVIEHATINEALNHPNWNMGAKVTIDSATLMNKALELIEAHWLFGLPASKLGAVIHPQSIVHAMVECADASVIAQMGAPDMRAPIQHALCDTLRPDGCAPRLDVTKLGSLVFIEIDPSRFPAIPLAMRTIEAGGDAGAALNAANEHAVRLFMDGSLPFGQIDRCVEHVMSSWIPSPIHSIGDVLDADERARVLADEFGVSRGTGVQ